MTLAAGGQGAPRLHPPSYRHTSLPQVLPAIAESLGESLGPGRAGDIALPPAQSAVVVLLDGLGLELLKRRAGHAPYLRSLLPSATELTCGFPSTTATSLASLGTGLAPGVHGLLGYELRRPDTGAIFDHLSWEGGPDPLVWQPNQTAFEELARCGLEVVRIGLARFDGSGLTVAAQRGGRFRGAGSLSAGVREAVRAVRAMKRGVVYLYWGDIDRAGHMSGLSSPQWVAMLEEADAAMRALAEQVPRHTSVTITADHGMVDVPFADRIDLATDPELAAGVHAITHEPRAPHVYCEPGAVASVAATWTTRLAGAASVLTREQAIDEAWFGPMSAANAPRIGDLVVVMGPTGAIEDSRTSKPILLQLIGLHGSVTQDEIAVPLLHQPAVAP